jgi:anaerobic ribonucleoside-triphosphate reductase activating protein
VTLNLSKIAYPITALGPGKRIALWVAGCPLRCRGCISAELLPKTAGKEIPVARLVRRLLALSDDYAGVTLSGGEPFAQAQALSELLAGIGAARPHWTWMAFSGFTIERLRRGTSAQQRLLAKLDALVDGPYVMSRPGTHPLTASANQRLHLLSPRARASRGDYAGLPTNQANLGLHPTASDWLIGVVQPEARQRLHRELALTRPVEEGS